MKIMMPMMMMMVIIMMITTQIQCTPHCSHGSMQNYQKRGKAQNAPEPHGLRGIINPGASRSGRPHKAKTCVIFQG